MITRRSSSITSKETDTSIENPDARDKHAYHTYIDSKHGRKHIQGSASKRGRAQQMAALAAQGRHQTKMKPVNTLYVHSICIYVG